MIRETDTKEVIYFILTWNLLQKPAKALFRNSLNEENLSSKLALCNCNHNACWLGV